MFLIRNFLTRNSDSFIIIGNEVIRYAIKKKIQIKSEMIIFISIKNHNIFVSPSPRHPPRPHQEHFPRRDHRLDSLLGQFTVFNIILKKLNGIQSISFSNQKEIICKDF